MAKYDFVPEFVLDNAQEDAEKFFAEISSKYNVDLQASIIMLLVYLISEKYRIPADDLWASLVVAATSADQIYIKNERRKKKKT